MSPLSPELISLLAALVSVMPGLLKALTPEAQASVKDQLARARTLLPPAGSVATSGAARRSYSAAGPGYKANIARATPTAMAALISRSRNSTRCCTKGCSVPASSSGGVLSVAMDGENSGF